ncbi:MAG: putative metal-dependent hydrolase, TIM-barrel fold [Actinomycetia bacterium]|nr:putative metal-dependent hydrolase, TIM-barrel fold [Actinomycetes bacterium]
MSERLISADSHVSMSHKQIKSHLATRHHASYDVAAGRYEASMQHATGSANREGAKLVAENAVFRRPGYWDPVERLKDMDTDGVEVEVLYSEVSAFRYLSNVQGAVAESVRGFNDALCDFAQADPKRLIVSYQIPIHDIDVAVAEVTRVAALGARSLQLPVFPGELGEADYHDPRYAPLFALIEETGLPICCHIGLKMSLEDVARRDPTPQRAVMVSMTPLMTAEALGMWIMGGVFEKFPRLKVVFVEPGLLWVAWWLEIVDDMAKRQGYEYPALRHLPSFYFHRNVSLSFIDERLGLERVRDVLGVENLLWSTDFPHPVTSWPNSRTIVEEQFADIPAPERELMLSGNALRVWGL